MANNIKSTNLPLILTGRGVKPTVPSNIRAVFGDNDFDVTSDLMVGQQAYNVDDDIWYYRNKKGISTLDNDGAIISPNGEVYIPADAETPNFISMAFDNNQTDKVYKFNNNTETYQNLDLSNYDQGLSTLVEGAGNDIMIIRLTTTGTTGTTYIYKAIGVNIDNTLNDVSSGIRIGSSSSGVSGYDIEHYAYTNNDVMQVYQYSANGSAYEYVIRTNYAIHLNIPARDYAWYGLEKLNDDWFIIYEEAVNENLYAKAIINWDSSPKHIIDLSLIYTSSNSPAYKLLRTIPSSYVYYDVNAEYPLLPGLYETDGRWGVVFNDDPMMYHHSFPLIYGDRSLEHHSFPLNSDFTSDLIHDYDNNAYSIIGLVDSPTRKILIVRYGESYSLSFYDVDNQEYIEPTYIDSPYTYTLDEYSDSIFDNVHELSNGRFVAVVNHKTFTSPDLRTWNMVIGTYLIP